ncbi:hypothetical protein SUGI_0476300 [Cryptomeria japonica]|nr:hypothetical protein SUGI_0476300 [Cryptomeria japonica]
MMCRRRCLRRGCPLGDDNIPWMGAGILQSGPLSDLECMLKEMKLELAGGLKVGIARAKSIEMNSEIWSSLPEELLMLIVANLSTLISGRFSAVCKHWKHLLSPGKTFISAVVPICSSPAFLFGCFRPSCLTKYLLEDWYLFQSEPTCPMYKFSLEFLEQGSVNVVTVCKSLLCCSKDRTSTSFCICNPVTRTWIVVPPATQLKRWDFIGLAFDTSTRMWTLVIGMNQGTNNIVMEIYDSETNGWAKLEINNPSISIFPSGEGLYSRGKFYWINKSSVNGIRWRFRFDVVAFNVAERSWDIIRQPERQEGPEINYFADWELSGCDGNVVLVYNKELSLWRLIEDEDEGKIKYRWSEFQPIPRSLCEEALHGRNINNDLNGLRISRRVVKRSNYRQREEWCTALMVDR